MFFETKIPSEPIFIDLPNGVRTQFRQMRNVLEWLKKVHEAEQVLFDSGLADSRYEILDLLKSNPDIRKPVCDFCRALDGLDGVRERSLMLVESVRAQLKKLGLSAAEALEDPKLTGFGEHRTRSELIQSDDVGYKNITNELLGTQIERIAGFSDNMVKILKNNGCSYVGEVLSLSPDKFFNIFDSGKWANLVRNVLLEHGVDYPALTDKQRASIKRRTSSLRRQSLSSPPTSK